MLIWLIPTHGTLSANWASVSIVCFRWGRINWKLQSRSAGTKWDFTGNLAHLYQTQLYSENIFLSCFLLAVYKTKHVIHYRLMGSNRYRPATSFANLRYELSRLGCICMHHHDSRCLLSLASSNKDLVLIVLQIMLFTIPSFTDAWKNIIQNSLQNLILDTTRWDYFVDSISHVTLKTIFRVNIFTADLLVFFKATLKKTPWPILLGLGLACHQKCAS